jgi:RNase H-fold protein (predicted Holliday junction resolvase)
LTTNEAVAKMREIGKKVKDEDAISAALILQAYLDKSV